MTEFSEAPPPTPGPSQSPTAENSPPSNRQTHVLDQLLGPVKGPRARIAAGAYVGLANALAATTFVESSKAKSIAFIWTLNTQGLGVVFGQDILNGARNAVRRLRGNRGQ